MSFEKLGLCEPLVRAVAAEGYTVPTPIQAQAIPHLLEGRDLLGCAQTGTGKTAAFALPTLQRLGETQPAHRRGRTPIRVLVLSPTRELAAQIADSFRTYGRHTKLRQTVIFGGVNQNPQTRALERGVEIVIATPGRLCDLMNQGYVDLSGVEIFVLDEADRMLDMGFLPDMRRVIAKLPRERQTVLMSATMPGPIAELAATILREPVEVRVEPVDATRRLIEQSVHLAPKSEKSRMLVKLMETAAVERAIVFTRTKHGADKVATQLNRAGLRAEAIHGNKSQNARQRTLANFKSQRPPILVATDIAARGIDVDGVSHVVNFDLPHEPETYVHRIGRTGRAGATGIAVSFCDAEERKLLAAIEQLIGQRLRVDSDALPAEARRHPATTLGSARPPRGGAPGKPKRPGGGRWKSAKPARASAPAATSSEPPRPFKKKRKVSGLGRN